MLINQCFCERKGHRVVWVETEYFKLFSFFTKFLFRGETVLSRCKQLIVNLMPWTFRQGFLKNYSFKREFHWPFSVFLCIIIRSRQGLLEFLPPSFFTVFWSTDESHLWDCVEPWLGPTGRQEFEPVQNDWQENVSELYCATVVCRGEQDFHYRETKSFLVFALIYWWICSWKRKKGSVCKICIRVKWPIKPEFILVL